MALVSNNVQGGTLTQGHIKIITKYNHLAESGVLVLGFGYEYELTSLISLGQHGKMFAVQQNTQGELSTHSMTSVAQGLTVIHGAAWLMVTGSTQHGFPSTQISN